nr:hypothetical protein [Butyrivibrio sp. WCE2006]
MDELPKIVYYHQDWDWKDLNNYYTQRYGKPVKPIKRRSECDIPEDCTCPSCHAPQPYLYKNNGKAGQILCKICQNAFTPGDNRFDNQLSLKCPHYQHIIFVKQHGNN